MTADALACPRVRVRRARALAARTCVLLAASGSCHRSSPAGADATPGTARDATPQTTSAPKPTPTPRPAANNGAGDHPPSQGLIPAPPASFTRDGREGGWFRIVHLAPALGRVKLVGQSPPQYPESHFEMVIEPGTTSGYIPVVSTPYDLRLVPPNAPATAPSLVTGFRTDVYNLAACTALIVPGYPMPNGHTPRATLMRVTDIPRRPPAGRAFVRFALGIGGRGPFEIREGETLLVSGLSGWETSGLKEVAAGSHRFTLRTTAGRPEGGFLLADLPENTLTHTLWVYRPASRNGYATLITEDVPHL